MLLPRLLAAFLYAPVALAIQQSAQIFIQPIPATSSPKPLAEITYDTLTTSSSSPTSSLVSYEPPELPEDASLVRIGLFDPKASQWQRSTTVASTANFEKGYAPTIIVSTDKQGEILSVGLKGVRIDAGATRDFGPKVVVVTEQEGKHVEVGKPIVLSREGKRVEETEKTFFQKYWWLLAIVGVMALTGGGGQEGK